MVGNVTGYVVCVGIVGECWLVHYLIILMDAPTLDEGPDDIAERRLWQSSTSSSLAR